MGAAGWCTRRPNLERALFEEGIETTAELAELAGVSERTARGWMRCQASPGPGAMRLIADALGMSVGPDCEDVLERDMEWLLAEVRLLEWDGDGTHGS